VNCRTACVTIRDRDGRPFVNVTAGHSLFEVVANAIRFFADDFWRGPKPRRDTVYEVSLVGDDRTWQVHALSVERWRAANLTATENPKQPIEFCSTRRSSGRISPASG